MAASDSAKPAAPILPPLIDGLALELSNCVLSSKLLEGLRSKEVPKVAGFSSESPDKGGGDSARGNAMEAAVISAPRLLK
jgi:hypothetical protein